MSTLSNSGAPDSGAFGPRIRTERQRQGRSLRELATDIGVSASLISQIENGKATPSVTTLYALVTALGLSMDEVFDVGPAKEDGPIDGVATLHVDAAGEHASTSSSAPATRAPGVRTQLHLETGVRWDRLTPPLITGTDFMLVEYAPGAQSSPEGHFQRHTGWEWGYVLEGRLQVSLGFDEHVLDPGMAISYPSSTPHRLVAVGDQPARAVWFVLGGDDKAHRPNTT